MIERQIQLQKKINNSKQKDNIIFICKSLQHLVKLVGMDNKEINKVIQDFELPLGLHLFITGNFSGLMSLNYK